MKLNRMYRKNTKLLQTTEINFLLVTLFIDGLSIGISNPILPKLIEEQVINLSTASYYFGAISAIHALMLFIFSPIQGSLSDYFGRKPLLLFSLSGTGLSQLLLAVAPNFYWMLVAQLLNGLTGACLAVVFASIADLTTPQFRAKSFGLVGVILGIAWVISPALGGLLSLLGLRIPFLVAAGVTLLNFIYGALFVRESHPPSCDQDFSWSQVNPFNLLKRLYQNSIISKLAVVIFCIDLALQCFVSTWILFTTYKFHWSLLETSLSLTLLGLMTAIAQCKVIYLLIDRFGERQTITFGLIFSLTGYLLYILVDQAWMIYGVIILNSFDFLTKPIAQGLLSRYIHPSEQGVIQGALASQTALAAILGSLLATNLFGYFTSSQAFLLLPEAPLIVGSFLFIFALWLNVTKIS